MDFAFQTIGFAFKIMEFAFNAMKFAGRSGWPRADVVQTDVSQKTTEMTGK